MHHLSRVLILTALIPLTAIAQDKPVVFNNFEGGDTPYDRAVKSAFAERYEVRDITPSGGYAAPTPLEGTLPYEAKSDTGELLEGYVLIAYVIDRAGKATDPVILKSSDEALNATALAAVDSWKFVPGSVKGTPVATTAAQEFIFKVAQAGFETTNIVLYQPDDVLAARLPGAGHLAAYIEKLQATLTEFFAKSQTAANLDVVVAVRPEGRSQIWFAGTGVSTEDLATLKTKLAAIPPVTVKNGPVAFAISGQIAGGGTTTSTTPPMPKEWTDAVKTHTEPAVIPDDILAEVWPENTGNP